MKHIMTIGIIAVMLAIMLSLVGVYWFLTAKTIGDMNGDGVLDDDDVTFLAEYIIGTRNAINASGDVNCDGIVNSGDVHYLASHLAGISAYEILYPSCDPWEE